MMYLKLPNLEICFIPFSKEEIYPIRKNNSKKEDTDENKDEGLIDYKIMTINSQRYEVYLLIKK